MKKVLIIAHLLRTSPRIPGLAKYLPKTQYADTFDSYLIKKFGLNPVEGIESKDYIKEKLHMQLLMC